MPQKSHIHPLLILAAVLGIVFGLVRGLTPLADETSISKAVSYPWYHADIIEEACERNGVDPYLVCAIIKCESNWRDDAVSGVGAQGLMQIMPQTAESLVDLGLIDANSYEPSKLYDPRVNIEYGCVYIAFLERELDTQEEIIAAYNAGIGNVSEWKASLQEGENFVDKIPFSETQAYVNNVLNALGHYRELYPTPPIN